MSTSITTATPASASKSRKDKDAATPNERAEKPEKAKAADAAARLEKLKMLDATVQKIERDCGKGSIMRLGADTIETVEFVATGSLALDKALGIGGLPRGRIVEIFGPESSGKTTLALHAIAETQARGGVTALIDAEHAFDPTYAKRIGVDLDLLLVSQPDFGEQALNIAEKLVSSGNVDLVVVDSVAALVPKAELDGEIGDSHVGLQARLMSQALRKLTAIANHNQTCLIFINQLREKIGVMFGTPETTPGGRALKFYSSVRLDVRRIQQLKDGDRVFGNRTRVTVAKNKVAPPFVKCEFDIVYGMGIDSVAELLDVGQTLGLITATGSWFNYGELRLGQGRANARAFLADPANKDVKDRLKAGLIEKLFPPKADGAAADVTPMALGLTAAHDDSEAGAEASGPTQGAGGAESRRKSAA